MGHELSFCTSLAMVGRLGEDNGYCKQTERHYKNLYIDHYFEQRSNKKRAVQKFI